VSDLIDQKKNATYKNAVDAVARIQKLCAATGDTAGWDIYLAEVVRQHRQKSNLGGKIRDKGWL